MAHPALKLARDEEAGRQNFLRAGGPAPAADPAPFIRHFLSRSTPR